MSRSSIGQSVSSWILGAGLALSLGAWTCPAWAQQDQPQQGHAQQNTPQPGQQGDWGPAGPPPDVQNGQVPAPPAAEEQGEQAPAPAQPNVAPNTAPAPGVAPNSAPPNEGQYEGQSRPPYRGESSAQGYEGQPPAYPGQQPGYREPQYAAPAVPAGPVTIPLGTTLQVRTAQPLDTKHLQAGDYFQATVARSVYSGNLLAIPRGAELTGRVVDVKKAGDLKGSAGLALQITSLTLGGHSYPLVTDTWSMKGPGKGGYTAGTTVGTAVLGAMIGAIAGGGPGAAIGAAAGTGAGLGASAATPGPRGVIPPEATLSFRLSHPVTVHPVSYEEAQRLQQNSAPPQQGYPPPRQSYYGYPPTPPYYPYAYAAPYPYPYGYAPYPYAYAYGYGYPYPYRYPYRYRYWR